MTPEIEIGKKYKNSSGEWSILTTERPNHDAYPVLAMRDDGEVDIFSIHGFPPSGKAGDFLIEVKEKNRLDGFLNVYENGAVYYWATKSGASANLYNGTLSIIAIIDLSKYNIEYEIGEGIEP